MGILNSYKEKLSKLKEQKEKLLELQSEIPDVRYLTVLLDAQIRDTESRINKLTSLTESIQCVLCKQWVEVMNADNITEINNEKICPNCLNTISEVYTTKEAEKLWGLKTGRIKQDILRNKLDPYVKAGLIRKSGGKYWLVHELVSQYYKEE